MIRPWPGSPARRRAALAGALSGALLSALACVLALGAPMPSAQAEVTITPAFPAPTAEEAALTAEAVAKLQALIRVDTTNPPGGEAAAARLVGSWLAAEGIAYRLYESAPGRLNLVARLKGSGEAPPLLLLNHLDVVTAEPTRWKQPPFSGAVADGAVWGRGALDMKGLGVMELLAFLSLQRRHVPLGRDVIFCATADEEAGGDMGAHWLLTHEPEAVRASEVLNEGGSGFIAPSGAPLMGIQVAERGVLWARLTAHGKPGHGSQERPDSATRRLLRAMAKVESHKREAVLLPETQRMFTALAGVEHGLNSWALSALATPGLSGLVAPRAIAAQPGLASLLQDSWNPTVLKAGEKVNVVPGTAEAEIDIRMLPGHTAQGCLAELTRVVDDPAIAITVLHGRDPSRSPASGRLFEALGAASRAEYPGVVTTPVLTPGGGTDSAFFRDAGAACYGLLPILATQAQLESMHGDNEYVTVEQLTRGTRVVTRAVEAAARPLGR